MGRRWLLLVAATVCLAGTGCSIPERGEAVPRVDTVRALPLGIPNARFYADGDPKAMLDEGMQSGVREAAALRAEGKLPTRPPPAYFLAVSGGGELSLGDDESGGDGLQLGDRGGRRWVDGGDGVEGAEVTCIWKTETVGE